eukprot:scaffold3572_cov125-Isochrysis_galbana.AAC.9
MSRMTKGSTNAPRPSSSSSSKKARTYDDKVAYWVRPSLTPDYTDFRAQRAPAPATAALGRTAALPAVRRASEPEIHHEHRVRRTHSSSAGPTLALRHGKASRRGSSHKGKDGGSEQNLHKEIIELLENQFPQRRALFLVKLIWSELCAPLLHLSTGQALGTVHGQDGEDLQTNRWM